jgi:hypothetical protein
MTGQIEIVRQTIEEFCLEFLEEPYLCYTEHGLHALFYTKLYNAFSAKNRYVSWRGFQVCVIQKEYPTASKLGKPQRQHWDISIIKSPPESKCPSSSPSYDYLKLDAVVEFGMNEGWEHLQDDIDRVCHHEANVENSFVIHLYRLSKAGARRSNRDWSPGSRQLVLKEEIVEFTSDKPVEVFYGLVDISEEHISGVWQIKSGMVTQIARQ